VLTQRAGAGGHARVAGVGSGPSAAPVATVLAEAGEAGGGAGCRFVPRRQGGYWIEHAAGAGAAGCRAAGLLARSDL